MSTNTGKKNLIMGLKAGVIPGTQQTLSAESVLADVKKEFAKAEAAWFQLTSCAIDQDQPRDVFPNELRTMVKKEQWEGVAIGYGLRGSEELTPLFEAVVNTVLETAHPTPKFLFVLNQMYFGGVSAGSSAWINSF